LNRKAFQIHLASLKMESTDILTGEIISHAIKVHRLLGPGLLESAYKECLWYELVKAGFDAEKEKPMPLIYETVKLECGYRLDLLVGKRIVVEVKSVESLADVHLAQVLTYLKLSKCRFGLLLNFNVALMKTGIKRVVNGY
jgi:GxxExxY protein